MHQYAGYLIQRENYQKNRQLAKIGGELFKGNPEILLKPHVTLEECLHILVRNKLDKVKYYNLRAVLSKHVSMVPYHLLSKHRTNICPPTYPYPPGASLDTLTGIFSCLEESLVAQLLRLIQFDGEFLAKVNRSCCLKVIGGMDNAGDEKEYQQRSQVNLKTSHVENGSFIISSIHLETGLDNVKDSEVEKFYGFDHENCPRNETGPKLVAIIKTLEAELEDKTLGDMLEVVLEGFDAEVLTLAEQHSPEERFKVTGTSGVNMASVIMSPDPSAISYAPHPMDTDKVVHAELPTGHPPVSEAASLLQQAKNDPSYGFSHLPRLKKPLGYKELGDLVWGEPTKGSVRNHRPWFRIYGKENPETLRPLFKNVIEPQVKYEINLQFVWKKKNWPGH